MRSIEVSPKPCEMGCWAAKGGGYTANPIWQMGVIHPLNSFQYGFFRRANRFTFLTCIKGTLFVRFVDDKRQKTLLRRPFF